MKTIIDILQENDFNHTSENVWTMLDKSKDKYEYIPEGNHMFFTKKISLTEKDIINRYGTDIDEATFEMFKLIPDTLAIIYNSFFDTYCIYYYQKIYFGGSGFYAFLHDDTVFDYKEFEAYKIMNIPEGKYISYIKDINDSIHQMIDKQGNLNGTVSGPSVFYDGRLAKDFSQEISKVKKYIDLFKKYNLSDTNEINTYDKYWDAINNDDYGKLKKIMKPYQYYKGEPLVRTILENNCKNCFEEIIKEENASKIVNGFDLRFEGCPANYLITSNLPNVDKIYYFDKLLELGYDINSRDLFGRNILYDVIEIHDNELLDYIMNIKELEIDDKPKELLFSSQYSIGGFDGSISALQYAIVRKNYYATKKLANKDNINLYTISNAPCLYLAMQIAIKEPENEEIFKIIKLLLELEADIHWIEEDNLPYKEPMSNDNLLSELKENKKYKELFDEYESPNKAKNNKNRIASFKEECKNIKIYLKFGNSKNIEKILYGGFPINYHDNNFDIYNCINIIPNVFKKKIVDILLDYGLRYRTNNLDNKINKYIKENCKTENEIKKCELIRIYKAINKDNLEYFSKLDILTDTCIYNIDIPTFIDLCNAEKIFKYLKNENIKFSQNPKVVKTKDSKLSSYLDKYNKTKLQISAENGEYSILYKKENLKGKRKDNVKKNKKEKELFFNNSVGAGIQTISCIVIYLVCLILAISFNFMDVYITDLEKFSYWGLWFVPGIGVFLGYFVFGYLYLANSFFSKKIKEAKIFSLFKEIISLLFYSRLVIYFIIFIIIPNLYLFNSFVVKPTDEYGVTTLYDKYNRPIRRIKQADEVRNGENEFENWDYVKVKYEYNGDEGTAKVYDSYGEEVAHSTIKLDNNKIISEKLYEGNIYIGEITYTYDGDIVISKEYNQNNKLTLTKYKKDGEIIKTEKDNILCEYDDIYNYECYKSLGDQKLLYVKSTYRESEEFSFYIQERKYYNTNKKVVYYVNTYYTEEEHTPIGYRSNQYEPKYSGDDTNEYYLYLSRIEHKFSQHINNQDLSLKMYYYPYASVDVYKFYEIYFDKERAFDYVEDAYNYFEYEDNNSIYFSHFNTSYYNNSNYYPSKYTRDDYNRVIREDFYQDELVISYIIYYYNQNNELYKKEKYSFNETNKKYDLISSNSYDTFTNTHYSGLLE